MRLEIDTEEEAIALEAPTTSTPTVRQIPGVRHNSRRQVWLLPLSWASCVTARGVLGSSLEIGPQLRGWAEQERAQRIDPSLELRTATDVAIGGTYRELIDQIELAEGEDRRIARSPLRLRPDQRAGATFLAIAQSALLGDSMRLGKSCQAIRALQLLDALGSDVYPVLVVSPNSVKDVWRREMEAWWPEARVVVAGSGTAAARKAIAAFGQGDDPDVLIINYEALSHLSNLAHYGGVRRETCSNCDPLSTRSPSRCQTEPKELNAIPWRTVIADEAHRVKDPKAQQTRALWALGDKATYRFGLTGTPPERPDEFWSIMHFIEPEDYPAKTAWIDRYVLTIPNIFSGFSDTVGFKPETREEFDRILLPRFIRRTTEMVFPDDLPPIYMPRYIELSGKQATAYKAMAKNLLAEVNSGVIFTSSPLTKLIRLRQLASAYGTATENGGMLLTEPSSKLDDLEDVLEELGDEQAVIFAESKQLIDMLAARLDKSETYSYGRVTGGQNPDQRAEAIALFQLGTSQLLLCTVAAGGEGLNMSAANTAIFLQRPWSAVQSEQAEKRIYMPGTDATTTIIDLITKGTVEEAVGETLKNKADKLEELVHDADVLRQWLTYPHTNLPKAPEDA